MKKRLFKSIYKSVKIYHTTRKGVPGMQHHGGISLTFPLLTVFLVGFLLGIESFVILPFSGLLWLRTLCLSTTEPWKYSVINLFPEKCGFMFSTIAALEIFLSVSGRWFLLRSSLSAWTIFFLGPSASIPILSRSCNKKNKLKNHYIVFSLQLGQASVSCIRTLHRLQNF